ncbi:MAG: DMT family transporter [Pacificimonas sp.]
MNVRHVASLAIVTLIWGTTWYVIKTQLGTVPPEWSVAYRFGLASLVMFAIVLATGRQVSFPLRAHVFFFLLGLAQFAANFNFVYYASTVVTSGLIAVAFALLMIPNAIMARVFLGQPISARFMVGAALGIVGVALLFRQELIALEGTPALAFGLVTTACAVMSASTANVMQASRLAHSLPMISMLAFAMGYGALLDALYAFWRAGPPVFEANLIYASGLAYLSIFASAIAFVLYFGVIRAVGPALAAYSGVLVPFVAMTVSTLFEGYMWTGPAIVGAVLSISGMVIALSARRSNSD